MFTTIEKLRASHAQQNRVSTVDNWHKRNGGNWLPTDKLAIFAIANSNSVDDVDWVCGTSSTHVAWPAMEAAVLKAFGHKTKGEHMNAIQSMLRAGKAKALPEITAKYHEAYSSLGAVTERCPVVGYVKPAEAAPAAETAAPVADATEQLMSSPANAAHLNESVAQLAAGQTTERPLIPVTEEAPVKGALVGAFYIAIGKIIALKDKTFDEAVQWATSPTGGRTYSQFAMENGVDGVDARAFLKSFNAKRNAQ